MKKQSFHLAYTPESHPEYFNFKSKKGGGDGGASDAIKTGTDRAIGFAREGRDMGLGFLNQAEDKALNPYLGALGSSTTGLNNAQNDLSNFDQFSNDQYQSTVGDAQRDIAGRIGDYFGQLGAGGRNNSRGQQAVGKFGEETAYKEGLRKLGIRQQSLADIAGRQQAALGVINPYSQGVSNFGTARANTATGTGSTLANIANSGGQALGGAMQQAEQARQAQKASKGAGIGGLASGVLSLGTSAATAFSDERLKENIKSVGKLDNGLNVYSYNFKGSPKTEIGLIAQEVIQLHPRAVHKDPSGYLKVDYLKAVA